jgi:tetratricopeptide (TPR) repeat protein
MGEYSKALSYYEKALEIRQKTLPANHPDFAQSYNNIGSVFDSMGEYSKALSYFERALDILQRSQPPNHPNIKTVKKSIEIVKKKL